MDRSYLFWCIVCILSWGIAPILEKLGLLRVSPSVVMLIQSLTMVGCILAINIFKSQESLIPAGGISWLTLAIVIGAGVVGGLIGEYAYLRAISSSDTGSAVAITSAYPLVTVMASIFILQEQLTVSTLFGGCFIVAGIVMITSNSGTA